MLLTNYGFRQLRHSNPTKSGETNISKEIQDMKIYYSKGTMFWHLRVSDRWEQVSINKYFHTVSNIELTGIVADKPTALSAFTSKIDNPAQLACLCGIVDIG